MNVSVGRSQDRQPALQITSPTNNTVVNPGQTIAVTVTSSNNPSSLQVLVMGNGSIGATAISKSLPAHLSLEIPPQIALGRHFLTAFGAAGTGNEPELSAQVVIDVERADLPARLRADPDGIIFNSSLSDTEILRISATFSDGSYLNATGSAYMAFASSNTAVATVNKDGIVTSVAHGKATITATYTLGSQHISVSVPVTVTVPPPSITVSPTSIDFSSQNVGTTSSPQPVKITNVSTNPGMTFYPLIVLGDFSETDNCFSTSAVDVGATCTVSVTFAPTASGPQTGALCVQDELEDMPVVIPLTGTGLGNSSSGASTSRSSITMNEKNAACILALGRVPMDRTSGKKTSQSN